MSEYYSKNNYTKTPMAQNVTPNARTANRRFTEGRLHMKPYRILSLLLAAVLTISYGFPAHAVSENDILSDEDPKPVSVSGSQSEISSQEDSAKETASVSDNLHEENSGIESDSVNENQPEENSGTESGVVNENQAEENSGTESDFVKENQSEENSGTEPDSVSENHSEIQVLNEKPGFEATLKHSSDGYIVKGSFTEFLPDTTLVQPQSSLDGEIWQDCSGLEWNLSHLGSDDAESQHALQNQICLYDKFEPLKSYLSGKLDRFYVRLHITRENGISYETQAAVIERGDPQPIPEGITYSASFTPAMLSREVNSSGAYVYCGKYQLTVSADASAEDIAALLPDTLPIQVDLQSGRKPFANCTIDCPVTWKSLSLPALTAGESVILRDAAEEIRIPAGTLLSTPMGCFILNEPLGIESGWWVTDEVILVLNVISSGENPTGVLAINNNELKMAFNLKPTGATAVRAYTLADSEAEWKELTGLPLLDAVNSQPATANSGYVDILRSDQEPYRSYLAAEFSGEEPKPFLVGLVIEGGVYDGCQLILACPDTYELPPDLVVGGSGGNEANAGSGSRNDSTEDGQRPNLPPPTSDGSAQKNRYPVTAAPPTGSSPNPDSISGNSADTGSRPQTATAGTPANRSKRPQANTETSQQAGAPNVTEDIGTKLSDDTKKIPTGIDEEQQTDVLPASGSGKLTADTSELPADTDTAVGTFLLLAVAVIVGIYIAMTAAKVISGRKTARL